MIETVFALIGLMLCFFVLFQFADNLRARLLCEYAAGRCARAATIGLNDYMVEKTAHVATMAAAGKCQNADAGGRAPGYRVWIGRAPDYLACEYPAQAREVLDFEFWRNGRTSARAVHAGSKIVATVHQRRPQFFNLSRFLAHAPADDEASTDDADIVGTAEIEAHDVDWLQ